MYVRTYVCMYVCMLYVHVCMYIYIICTVDKKYKWKWSSQLWSNWSTSKESQEKNSEVSIEFKPITSVIRWPWCIVYQSTAPVLWSLWVWIPFEPQNFSELYLQMLKLLHNCKDHFHLCKQCCCLPGACLLLDHRMLSSSGQTPPKSCK